MQLEDYFVFLAPNDIRVRGTRVGIETILYDFIHRQRTPEEIAQSYPTLELEQIYATILYYLHNHETVSTYLTNWLNHGRLMLEQQQQNPSPVVVKLMELKDQEGK
ncbi:hypothetical protein BJP34_23875 [Moorena producens PAL-8-15-08-1]|uniref:DUF433 domain-containing protein n=1 Tax=Moorena producens PAL-8-15-08-1 TaxID=1458985 RepID=A0A1D8TWN6_9CYAN|nr:DUF433 domain-containing protein [Moorena producens]AOX02069.1 hypothetical protein BJP34_23875 [Moorena producens PAL-8-15-08-1]